MNKTNCNKTSISIRKLTYIFIIISLLALTGCTTKEERQEAKNNEVLAKPIVQEYLELNYGGGKVGYLDCLNEPGYGDVGSVPLFYKHASPFVKASVRVNDKEFLVIANVETGQCYDNYNESLVLEDLKSYATASLSIDVPFEIEVHYYPKELIGEVDDSKYENFAEYGVSSTADLFKNDQYRIYVVCKYVASDMNFGDIDTKLFFPEEVSEVYLALINFRSNDRYIDGDMVSVSEFRFTDHQHYYSLSDVVTAKKEKIFDSESQNYVYDDNVIYNYARYLSERINGIEFVWNDSLYSVDLEVVPAEKEIQTKLYEYYATNDEAVNLECTPRFEITDDIKNDIDNDIYCYFDKAMHNKEILITYNNDSYKEDVWTVNETLSLKTDSYIYDSLYISDNKKTTLTLGFYKEK